MCDNPDPVVFYFFWGVWCELVMIVFEDVFVVPPTHDRYPGASPSLCPCPMRSVVSACLLACWKCVQAIRACVSQQVLLFFFLAKEGTRADADAQARTRDMRRVTHRKQKSVVLQNHAITRRLTPKGGRKENRCKLALCSKPKSTTLLSALQTPRQINVHVRTIRAYA